MRNRKLTGSMIVALALGAGVTIGSGRQSQTGAGQASPIVLDSTIAFWEARVKHRPGDVIAAVELSDKYMTRFGVRRDIDDVTRAEHALGLALAAHPGFAPALTRLAGVHIARHEFPEALAAAQAAYRSEPRRAMNGPLFDTFFEVGQYDSARAALNRMDPNSFGYAIRKARYAEAGGRSDIAQTALERACHPRNSHPTELLAWCAVRLGDAALAGGQLGRADSHYRTALEKWWPGYPAAVAALAQLAFRNGDLENARTLAERWTRGPDGAAGHLLLFRIARLMRDETAARAAGERFESRATNPKYGRAYWPLLARYYAWQGRLDTAITLAERDVAQRPGPEAYETLGAVLHYAGQKDRALAAIDEALRGGAASGTLLYYAGLIRVARGDDAGTAMLREALAVPEGLDPDQAIKAARLLSD